MHSVPEPGQSIAKTPHTFLLRIIDRIENTDEPCLHVSNFRWRHCLQYGHQEMKLSSSLKRCRESEEQGGLSALG